MAKQLLELDGSLTKKELVQMMKWPKTFEDSYVAMKTKSKAKDDGDANGTDSGSDSGDDETKEECDWTTIGDPKVRERSGWMKKPEGVCRVFTMPASPYPATITSWKEKRAWRYANKEAWN